MGELTNRRRRKRRHPNWPVRGLLFGLLASFFVFVILLPGIRFKLQYEGVQSERWELLAELILTHCMGWVFVLWVFFFGACLGSFLNVVAYRIPNGITIMGSSRCPWCLVPIELKYNFPILGWLMLRGRCAACRLPIAPRYMLVEIFAGLILLWLFAFELAANGENLPGDGDYRIGTLFRQLMTGHLAGIGKQDWALVRIFLLHCLTAYTLLTAALMRLDRLNIPPLWKLLHLAVPAVWIALWPSDMDFARADFQLENRFGAWLERIDFQFSGACVGGFLGYQYQRLSGDKGSGLMFAMILVGIACGLVATISIGFLFLFSWSLCRWLGRSQFFVGQPIFLLLIMFLIQIPNWAMFDKLSWWPGNSANTLVLIAYLLPSTAAVIISPPRTGE